MNIKFTQFFLCITAYTLTILPNVTFARKVVETNLNSVIDRSSIIISGNCISYQCISSEDLITFPIEKCKKHNSKAVQLYSVKIDKVILDRDNFIKKNMITSDLKVRSNRSDTNSICSGSLEKPENKLIYLNYLRLGPQTVVQAVYGNLLNQDLSNIRLIESYLKQ